MDALDEGHLAGDAPNDQLARDFLGRLLAGDRTGASELVVEAVEEGLSIRDAYLEVFQPVLWEVGRLWQINEIGVAEEHFCTAATQLTMSRLYPLLFGGERSGRRLVAACVGGNLHEVGVRMVSDFFEMEGWDTYYLGADTPLDQIVETARDRDADVLAVSATLDEHVDDVRELLRRLERIRAEAGLKVLVGGAPFRADESLWEDVGAYAWGADALAAVREGRRLVESR